jgi:glycerol-3-phosphate acyltransferase PlsY
MPGWVPLASATAGGYLLGAVSFALLLGRARGVDLRTVGSGNLGATNAGRALGRGYGLAVYLLDALKGLLPALLAPRLLDGDPALLGTLAGAGAVAGHVWPFWLRFRGGKGVATLSGALLALHPPTLAAGAVVHLLVVKATRVMALASLCFGVALGVAAWVLDAPEPTAWFACFAGLLLFWTHRSNLRRMLAGAEDRLGDPLEKNR